MIGVEADIEFRPGDHTYWKGGVSVPGFHEVMDYLIDGPEYYKNPNYYAWRGRGIHSATALIDTNSLNVSALEPDVLPYIDSYYAFLKEYEAIWLMIEQVVYHPKLRYCGTLDRYGMVDGNPCILDIKAGVPEKDKTALQLTAYAMCIPEVLQHHYVLYLSDSGAYKLINLYDPSLPGVWAGAMSWYWWRKRTKK